MVLLDTCSFIWLVSEQNNLSDAGRNFIDNNRNGLCISSISAFEIGIKHEKKRIILPLPPQDWIREALTYHGILDIPVDWEIAELATRLPPIHRDPCDRIIIATSKIKKLPVVTPDVVIRSYPGVVTIW